MKSKILLFVTSFFIISTEIVQAQNALENVLSKAFSSKDSSDYYFNKAYQSLKTQADTASYLYFKFFKKDAEKKHDSANYFAEKLIPIFQKLDSTERLRKVYLRQYYQYLHKGKYDTSLKEIQKALALATRRKDTAMMSLHNSDISILYHDYNLFEKGIEYGKKAFNIMNRATNKKYKYLIIANNAIAINFDDWNKPDSALYYHYKNLKYLSKVKDSLKFGFIFNNIANTNLKAGNYAVAEKFLKRSLALNLVTNKVYNLATNYTNLATITYKQNKNSEAKKYFKQASFYAKKSGSIEKIRDVLEQEYRFYKKIKHFEKALQKKESYYVLQDSVFNTKRASEFSELEIKYQTAKKERQIAKQKQELLQKEIAIKNRSLIALLTFAALLLIGIISVSFYRRNRLKQQQLKKEIELKDALATIKTQNKLQEQRLRISRDLHDNIGSQLTFVISSLDNLKYVSKDLNSKIKDKIDSISSFTSDTIHQLRDTIWAMNKNKITIEDLQTRILSFIEKAKIAKPNVEFVLKSNVKKEVSFTSIEGVNIFRVAQEAINNALKFANANTILVETNQDKNTISLSIKDNGKGFDIKTVQLGNGLGNMEKRMSEIGGQVFIKSKEGLGTTIIIQINTSNAV